MEIKGFLFRGFNICLAVVFLLCTCAPASAANVSLAWDPSTSPNVSGYRLYIGNASRNYNTPITLANQTTYTVTGLGSGTWFFAVTAFDADGNESDFSNEVSQVISTSTPRCNINGDATVDALDLQALANVILNSSPTSGSYDLNSDGRVDALDLQILNNVILGLRSCP
jgi:hypothetical protein